MTEDRKDVKITLYWLEQSRAQRILWLLEELKLPYELQRFKRDKGLLADPALQKIHPLGRSPVISVEVPGREKLVLAESGLIVEYLTEHFGPSLIPRRYREGCEGSVAGETDAWLRNRYFIHYSEGSLMPVFLVQLIIDRIRNAPVPFFIKPLTRGIAGKVDDAYLRHNMKLHLGFLEGQVKSAPQGGPYLCGPDLAGADIMMSYLLEIATASKAITADSHPALVAYLDRLRQREAYRKANDLIVELEGSCDYVPR